MERENFAIPSVTDRNNLNAMKFMQNTKASNYDLASPMDGGKFGWQMSFLAAVSHTISVYD